MQNVIEMCQCNEVLAQMLHASDAIDWATSNMRSRRPILAVGSATLSRSQSIAITPPSPRKKKLVEAASPCVQVGLKCAIPGALYPSFDQTVQLFNGGGLACQ